MILLPYFIIPLAILPGTPRRFYSPAPRGISLREIMPAERAEFLRYVTAHLDVDL